MFLQTNADRTSLYQQFDLQYLYIMKLYHNK